MHRESPPADSLSVLCNGPFGPVVRLQPGKKVPIGTKWRITDDNEEARNWLSTGSNVGIVTGRRVTVLDIDGVTGRQSLAALEAQHGALPPCPTVQTPRNGEHRSSPS